MKTIDLEFEDYPDTYTVVVSPVAMSAFDQVWTLHAAATAAFARTGDLEPLREFITEFVKVAKPTVKGKAAKLLDLDPNLVIQIGRLWHKGVRDVPLPLPRGSSVTGTSPAP